MAPGWTVLGLVVLVGVFGVLELVWGQAWEEELGDLGIPDQAWD